MTVAEKDQRCATRRNEQPVLGRVECGQRRVNCRQDNLDRQADKKGKGEKQKERKEAGDITGKEIAERKRVTRADRVIGVSCFEGEVSRYIGGECGIESN